MSYVPEIKVTLNAWGVLPIDIEHIVSNITPESEAELAQLIVNIDRLVKLNFNNPVNQKRFLSLPNKNRPFLGVKPIDYLKSGDIDSFRTIEKHLLSTLSPW